MFTKGQMKYTFFATKELKDKRHITTPLVVNLKTYFSFGEHRQSILHYLNCVSKPAYVTANLYLYSFFYFSPIFGLFGKPKYRANTFSIFISFIPPFLSPLAVSITLLL